MLLTSFLDISGNCDPGNALRCAAFLLCPNVILKPLVLKLK